MFGGGVDDPTSSTASTVSSTQLNDEDNTALKEFKLRLSASEWQVNVNGSRESLEESMLNVQPIPDLYDYLFSCRALRFRSI